MLRPALLTSVLLCAPAFAQADEMTLIVERGPTTVEVFVGLPAEGLVDVFALPPERLEDENGEVAFEPLRLGTWLIGDDVIAGVDTRVSGQPAVYEAMSLMVHPADQRLPLYDAMDGFTAIAVCSVEPPENPTLDTLYSYVGWITYPDDPSGALSFGLPDTGRAAITVEIRDFRQGELVAETVLTVPDGGEIALPAAPTPVNYTRVGGWAFFAALTLMGAGVLLRAHRSLSPSGDKTDASQQ